MSSQSLAAYPELHAYCEQTGSKPASTHCCSETSAFLPVVLSCAFCGGGALRYSVPKWLLSLINVGSGFHCLRSSSFSSFLCFKTSARPCRHPVHLFYPFSLFTCSPVLFTCSPVLHLCFTCSPAHLCFTCSPVLFTCSPAHLLTCSPAHLFCSPAHLLTCASPAHLFCSPAHLLTCSPAHLFCSPAHLLTCSVHLLTCSPVLHLLTCASKQVYTGRLF